MSSADDFSQNGRIRPFFAPYTYGSDLENPIQDYSYGSFSPRPSPANKYLPDNLQSYGDEEDCAESSKHEAEGKKKRWALKELLSNTEEEEKMYSAAAPKYHISSIPNRVSNQDLSLLMLSIISNRRREHIR